MTKIMNPLRKNKLLCTVDKHHYTSSVGKFNLKSVKPRVDMDQQISHFLYKIVSVLFDEHYFQ